MSDAAGSPRRHKGGPGSGAEEPPSDAGPITDEFGRDDPDVIEREQRRLERQRRRAKSELASGVGRPKKQKPANPAKPPRAVEPAEPVEPVRPATVPEPEASKPPKPPKPQRREPSRPYGRRRIFALAGILIGLLLVWFLVALFQPFAGAGLGTGRVVVDIPRGASAGEVADLLASKGVVSNSTLFQIRLKLAGDTNKLNSGPVAMASGMSYGAAIDRLTASSGTPGTLVVPEGDARAQIGPIAQRAGISGDYVAASTSHPGFSPAKYGAKKPPNLEGFLFPATYTVKPGETAAGLVGEQLTAFSQNLAKVNLSYAKKKNLSVYDVLTIASMVEREAQVPKDRALVAAVIYNRLHARMPLGIDATTRYETGNFETPLTSAELRKNTPYNTRIRPGLPPTPIGSPGLASIEAAAHPAKAPYLYYETKPNTCGELAFQRTLAEHNAAVAAYEAARTANGGNAPTKC